MKEYFETQVSVPMHLILNADRRRLNPKATSHSLDDLIDEAEVKEVGLLFS